MSKPNKIYMVYECDLAESSHDTPDELLACFYSNKQARTFAKHKRKEFNEQYRKCSICRETGREPCYDDWYEPADYCASNCFSALSIPEYKIVEFDMHDA